MTESYAQHGIDFNAPRCKCYICKTPINPRTNFCFVCRRCDTVICADCGTDQDAKCPDCSEEMDSRNEDV